MSDELKPCPFCGSHSVEDESTYYAQWATCNKCGAKAPNWNARAQLSAQSVSEVQPVAWVSGDWLLREALSTLKMWADVAPAVSLVADIEKYFASQQSSSLQIPVKEIEMILNEVMKIASHNGLNSISMPDEYVAVAHWLSYPHKYSINTAMAAQSTEGAKG